MQQELGPDLLLTTGTPREALYEYLVENNKITIFVEALAWVKYMSFTVTIPEGDTMGENGANVVNMTKFAPTANVPYWHYKMDVAGLEPATQYQASGNLLDQEQA